MDLAGAELVNLSEDASGTSGPLLGNLARSQFEFGLSVFGAI